jgi:uncharacterized protein
MSVRTPSLLLMALLATSAGAASFDCKLARSKAELLVCADPALSALDDELGKLFALALRASTDRRAFRAASDKEWGRREATCADRACVLDWYLHRRAQLTATVQAGAVDSGPAAAAAAAVDAPRQQLVDCLAPTAREGLHSSQDGGRSVRSMLVACPSESQAWVQHCVAKGETQEACTYHVAAVAQDTLKLMKK